MKTLAAHQLSLAPLGAGDLIDRAVRLYRRHFFTLIGITAPPVVVSTLGYVMLTSGWRELMATGRGVSLALSDGHAADPDRHGRGDAQSRHTSAVERARVGAHHLS